jgi:hypothetical protein
MPSGTLVSLADAIKVLDKVLEAEVGIRLVFDDKGRAVNFRQRLYTARAKDRELSRKQFEADSKHYGISPYDPIVISGPIPVEVPTENEYGHTISTKTTWALELRKAKDILGLVKLEEL